MFKNRVQIGRLGGVDGLVGNAGNLEFDAQVNRKQVVIVLMYVCISKWIESLSAAAVSKFLRAASHGVQLDESWIVMSAAAYMWNYGNHLMAQKRQHEIVNSLQSVLDAVKAVEIPR